MSRRPLSDQRHLLVELELDDGIASSGNTRWLSTAPSTQPYANTRRHSTQPTVNVHAVAARPQSATTRRMPTGHKLLSPYKLKQRVLSSRSRSALDDEDDAEVSRPRRAPGTARAIHDPPSMPSPLMLIADAVRQKITQRSRAMLDVQDELRHAAPLPMRRIQAHVPLLTPKCIKSLNRLRSLTLSIVEMIRYFFDQLPPTSGDPSLWALRHEFTDCLLRLCASDVDCLLSSTPFVHTFESLGVSVLRNPLLDGLSLDSSELLLCSCQSVTGTSREAVASSSLFQLLLSRLETFALQMRREYPSWQVLPQERVARALLQLLEAETKANATRMLPSYLQGDEWRHNSRRGSTNAMGLHQPAEADEEDDDDESVDQPPVAVAWAEESRAEEPRRQSLRPIPPQNTASLPQQPSPQTTQAPTEPPDTTSIPSQSLGRQVPEVDPPPAEPKLPTAGALHQPSKKAKRLTERSMTVHSLGSHNTESLTKRMQPLTLIAEKKTGSPPLLPDEEQRNATITSAMEKLPQFSLTSLGMKPAVTEPTTRVAPTIVEPTVLISPTPPSVATQPLVTCEPTNTDCSRACGRSDDADDREDTSTGSKLSFILSLCRDVQVAAIDLNQRLQTQSPQLSPINLFRPTSPLAALPTDSPRFTLSTRYLETELKMLRRFFRLWTGYMADRQQLVCEFRVACAGRRLVRFGQWILARQAARRRELAVRVQHAQATKIQWQWQAHCVHQQMRRRQVEFHLMHRCFKRGRFFTRVVQRQRRHREAAYVVQSWWRHQRFRKRTIEERRRQELEAKMRREAAALKLQTLVSHQLTRRKLAKALESNQQFMRQQRLRETKARQDEQKRQQIESKRRAELRVAMESIKRELEAKWRDAEDAKERLEHQHRHEQEQDELAWRQLIEKLARERIDRFMERVVLRRRVQESIRVNEAIALAHRQLEFVRKRLERQHQEDHAKRLLEGRMLAWKLAKSVATERCQAQQRRTVDASKHAIQRREDGATTARFVRTAVARAEVAAYCHAVTGELVESTYQARLRAKQNELTRVHRQAASERISGFVLHGMTRDALAKAQQAADRLRKEEEARVWMEQQAREEVVRQQARERREQSERLIARWVTEQVTRTKEKQRVEKRRKEAAAAALRETQRLEQEAIAREQRAIEEQRQQLLVDIQRQLDRERRLRVFLVDVMMATQRLADAVARGTIVDASTKHRTQCGCMEMEMKIHMMRARSIERVVSRRWRQFVVRRRTKNAITKEALWPNGDPHVSIVHTIVDDDTLELDEDQQHELRLYELRCIASARKVQRCWRAWRARLQKLKRQQAKAEEDAMVERAKGLAWSTRRWADESAGRVANTLASRRRRHRLQFQTRIPGDDATFTVCFQGGRACALRQEDAAQLKSRVRFDRVVTRKLLEATDRSVHAHAHADVDNLVHELVLDVHTLLVTADASPQATRSAAGWLEIGDVDEYELPRFSLFTRQLSKTRSIVKRTQLLDAKVSFSTGSAAVLTVWDAVASASVDDATFLLQQRVDLDVREPCQQRTPLHMLAFSDASSAQRVGMLRFLVHRAKADVHSVDASGDTPLMLFAARGCLALVDELVQFVDPHLWRQCGSNGSTAMHRACGQDQPEVAALLTRHVVSTALAIDTQRSALMELFSSDADGVSPVHILCGRGFHECMVHVLDACGPAMASTLLELRDTSGRTPLHLAIAGGYLDLVRLLVRRGADTNSGDEWGRRPLHYAVKHSEAVELLTLLLLVDGKDDGKIVDLQAGDDRGDTALHWAALLGRAAIVKHLLALGADPTVLNADWQTPAQVASAYRHYECKRLLMPTTLDVDSVDAPLSLQPIPAIDDDSHELPSPKSYYHPPVSPVNHHHMQASPPRDWRREIDWDELHQDVQLVEESGAFSSEDDDGSVGWSDEAEE